MSFIVRFINQWHGGGPTYRISHDLVSTNSWNNELPSGKRLHNYGTSPFYSWVVIHYFYHHVQVRKFPDRPSNMKSGVKRRCRYWHISVAVAIPKNISDELDKYKWWDLLITKLTAYDTTDMFLFCLLGRFCDGKSSVDWLIHPWTPGYCQILFWIINSSPVESKPIYESMNLLVG